jgi:hypothetical protein
MQTGGKTHEEDGKEQVALGVAHSLVPATAFLDAVDHCDDQREYKR